MSAYACVIHSILSGEEFKDPSLEMDFIHAVKSHQGNGGFKSCPSSGRTVEIPSSLSGKEFEDFFSACAEKRTVLVDEKGALVDYIVAGGLAQIHFGGRLYTVQLEDSSNGMEVVPAPHQSR